MIDKKKITQYYESRLGKYGDSPGCVDWDSKESQYLRFKVISQVGFFDGCSILDVGCGLGHFYDFLKEKGLNFKYKGIDISKKMIAHARTRLPEVDFEAVDLLSHKFNENYDFTVCSGTLYVHSGHSYEEWTEFCENMIVEMFRLSKVAVSFNMLTSYVDFKVEHLYYADPKYFFNFAKKLSRFVTLKHDYPLYEFTSYIYKNYLSYME